MSTTSSVSLAIAVSSALFASFTIGRDLREWWLVGRRVSIRLLADMRTLGWPQYEGQQLMVLNVTNHSDRPLTLAQVTLQYFGSRWDCWRGKPCVSATVDGANPWHAVPCILEPGKTWTAFLERDREIEAIMAAGHLYVGLTHSRERKTIQRRVTLPKSA